MLFKSTCLASCRNLGGPRCAAALSPGSCRLRRASVGSCPGRSTADSPGYFGRSNFSLPAVPHSLAWGRGDMVPAVSLSLRLNSCLAIHAWPLPEIKIAFGGGGGGGVVTPAPMAGSAAPVAAAHPCHELSWALQGSGGMLPALGLHSLWRGDAGMGKGGAGCLGCVGTGRCHLQVKASGMYLDAPSPHQKPDTRGAQGALSTRWLCPRRLVQLLPTPASLTKQPTAQSLLEVSPGRAAWHMWSPAPALPPQPALGCWIRAGDTAGPLSVSLGPLRGTPPRDPPIPNLPP